jgi:hypothetical protein
VARDLDEDPEQLALLCLPLFRYAEAKSALDRSKADDDLAGWKGSKVMDEVWTNTVRLKKERIAKRNQG